MKKIEKNCKKDCSKAAVDTIWAWLTVFSERCCREAEILQRQIYIAKIWWHVDDILRTLIRGWANFCVLGEITGFLFVSEIISMQIFLCNKIGTIWSLYSEIQKYLHFQPRVILIDPNIWNNFLFALKSLQTTYQ